MPLLVIVGLLTGAIVIMMIFKITRWWELIVLTCWGVLATVCVYNGYVATFWTAVTPWSD